MATGPRQLRLTGGCVGDAQHSHSGVIAELEQPPGVMERRQLLPASPYGARTGDAVTLAGRLQPTLHRLEKGGERRGRGKREICQLSQSDSLPGLLSWGPI